MLITEFMEGGDLYHAIARDNLGRFAWYRRQVSRLRSWLASSLHSAIPYLH